MLSIPQKIAKQIKEQLMYITTNNGYSITLKEAHKGFLDSAKQNDYPKGYVEFGEEQLTPVDDSQTFMMCELPVVVAIVFKSAKNNEALFDDSEKIKNDLKMFINGETSVSFNEQHTAKLNEISNQYAKIRRFYVESVPAYLDYNTHIGVVGVVVRIVYTNPKRTLLFN